MKTSRLLANVTLLLLMLPFLAVPVWAQSGARFFLLSDAAYGSTDTAMVRLETQELQPIAEYGGVDVYVYKVNKPLDF